MSVTLLPEFAPEPFQLLPAVAQVERDVENRQIPGGVPLSAVHARNSR
jgi:hypothetical protein